MSLSLQAKLQTASSEYQKLQAELSNAVESRQRLDAQLSENDLVKKEFAQLAPDNIVYKQIGPVLVKQDQAEAKSNVETRLEFIRGEIKRVETQLQDIQLKSENKKNEARPCYYFHAKTTNADPPYSWGKCKLLYNKQHSSPRLHQELRYPPLEYRSR
ncbi:Prefoldin [Mycena vulgaris]|nr:Prefoldin [Mycena vulgaris]